MNYNRSAVAVLVDHVKAKNPSFPLTAETAVFSTPSVATAEVSVTVTPVEGSGVTGSAEVTYGRFDVGAWLAGRTTAINATGMTMVSEVIDQIVASNSIRLVAGVDYTDEALPTPEGVPNETNSVTVAILQGSPLFVGSIELSLVYDAVDLADSIVDPALGPLPEPVGE